ncbi:hypothetical protein ACFYM7_32330, partial [Streptomyces cyaneofuscatus]
MAAEADGAAEIEVSPTGWVARQAELYESSGGTKGTTQLGRVRRIKAGQAAASGAVHRKALERPHRGAIRAFRQRREVPC